MDDSPCLSIKHILFFFFFLVENEEVELNVTFGVTLTWVPVLALPLPGCVLLKLQLPLLSGEERSAP